VRVLIPTHLAAYTDGQREVPAEGQTLGAVLEALEREFPGLRFRVVDEQDRVRPHIKFFVGSKMARTLDHPVGPDDTVQIVAALSGG
jgi:sulfur-carrier protein